MKTNEQLKNKLYGILEQCPDLAEGSYLFYAKARTNKHNLTFNFYNKLLKHKKIQTSIFINDCISQNIYELNPQLFNQLQCKRQLLHRLYRLLKENNIYAPLIDD